MVPVVAYRPTVPDAGGGRSAALVVLGPGTRTASELADIAQACADAGHRVLGAVVAYPTRPASPGRRRRRSGAGGEESAGARDGTTDGPGARDGTPGGPGAVQHPGPPGAAGQPGVLAGKP